VSRLTIVDDYFEAVNTENWELLTSVYHPDATYTTPGARPRAGRDDVVDLYRHLFDAWSVHLDTPGHVMAEADRAVVEVAFRGTARNGRDIAFDAVDLFSFADGMIVKAATWYDIYDVRRKLDEQVSA
jgi:ketosteroid isomerase-like protein